MDRLDIAPGVYIPTHALDVRAVRSSGPGGQHVNKVSSKIVLRVGVDAIVGLDAGARGRLQELAGHRWLAGDMLSISVSDSRYQIANRELAETRLVALVRACLQAPKARKKTRPTRGSQERRLESKRVRSDVKRGRSTGHGEE